MKHLAAALIDGTATSGFQLFYIRLKAVVRLINSE